MLKYISFLFVFFLFFSCVKEKKEKKIASVYKQDLYLSEVIENMPIQIEDSTNFIEEYINNWIRKNLMIHHAKINLNEEINSYKKQLDEYKYSLLIYAYQQQLLNYNFDTTITNDNIFSYYNQFRDEFKLNKDILRAKFIIIDKLAPNLNLLDKLISHDNDESKNKLFDYCQQFAKEYYIDDKWNYVSFYEKKINYPLNKINLSKKFNLFEDKNYKYYLFIKEFKLAGDISPLYLEKDKIRNVLLNKNKLKYLRGLEDELYHNALDLKKIKIY